MSLWTSLEPASTTVDPGGSARVRLRLRNTGDVVDEYRFVPVGDLSPWTTVEPPSIRLYPGTTGTVELTFAPPRTPDATAGPNPYGVQIIPTEHPEATTVPEGNVTITPFSEVRAELVPHTVKGRFRGRPKLAVDNLGNVKLTASIAGSDNSDQITYDLQPANIQVEPGRAKFIKTTLKPRQIIWAGSKQSRPFSLAIQRSGADPVPVQGTYVQPGLFPRWVGVVLGMLLALVLAFVMLWIAHKPQVTTQAGELAASQATKLPTPPVSTAPSPPAPTSAPPSPTPNTSNSPAGDSGGGGGGGKKKKKTNPLARVLLANGTTNKCAAPEPQTKDGDLKKVRQYDCAVPTDEEQVWGVETVFKGQGPANTDLVQIRNLKSGNCLDVPGNGADDHGTNLDLYPCTKTMDDNQLWYLHKGKDTNNLYWIRNYKSNGLCLDVSGYKSSGNDKAAGTVLTLYPCSNNDDQGWNLVKQQQSGDNQN
ncbi:RICIN domain-containing protein [Streptomyces montanisoli]|uniref:RICIN domain-containing protein n=1 Tax=Streptomyces montanisoli TaxID=2798581 RepID=A0A940RYM7_9ACTN|nr:RICIN domain-containing protein [Streptomyces montanisoli]MBP0458859.1 RICIN domain-containing protein [Streptomyces montanisoli]